MRKPNDTAKQPRIASGWQAELRGAVRDASTLAKRLGLDSLPAWVDPAFPLLAPEAFIARMKPGDPRDPLLLQLLPRPEEGRPSPPGYSADPVGELGSARHGLVRKYRGRALLIATGACPVHCRYCFRRHFPYGAQIGGGGGWGRALQAVAQDSSIHELILSGGDPLVLPDAKLGALLKRADGITHLRTVRIHTRTPVILPSRVTAGLLAVLRQCSKRLVMALHVNHPQEIDAAVAGALARLAQAGLTLLNQAVLLRGVNDSAETLAELSHALWQAGVLPYYLHLLDKVAGAAHFEVPAAEGAALVEALRQTLPGYLVPRLVRETPGAPAKQPVPSSP